MTFKYNWMFVVFAVGNVDEVKAGSWLTTQFDASTPCAAFREFRSTAKAPLVCENPKVPGPEPSSGPKMFMPKADEERS